MPDIYDLLTLKNKNDIANLEAANGDMTKEVYDTNDDGKVDCADISDAFTDLTTTELIDEDVKVGEIYQTNGFYAAGDGGHGLWRVTEKQTTNNTTILDTTNDLSIELIYDGFINVKSVGIKADGIKQSYEYHDTSTVLDGTNRDFWVSDSDFGPTNQLKFQSLLNLGCLIYAPKGVYVFDVHLVQVDDDAMQVNDNTTIIGDGMYDTIFTAFSMSNVITVEGERVNTGKGSNLLVKDLTIAGVVDITPPLQMDSEDFNPSFNPETMWDIFDFVPIVSKDGYTCDNGQGICIKASPIKDIKNITIENVRFENKSSATAFGVKVDSEPDYRVRNVKIIGCEFDNHLGQPIGFNFVTGIKILNNTFKNCYFQPFDISRGNIDSEVAFNKFDKCAQMGKVTGAILPDGTRLLSDKFSIHHNRFINPPTASDVHWKKSYIIDDLVGNGCVRDNLFEVPTYTGAVMNVSVKKELESDSVEIYNNTVTGNIGEADLAMLLVRIPEVIVSDIDYAPINMRVYNNKMTSDRTLRICGCYNAVDRLDIAYNEINVLNKINPASILAGKAGAKTSVSNNCCNETYYIFLNDSTSPLDTEYIVIKNNEFYSSAQHTSKLFSGIVIGSNSASNAKVEIFNNVLTEPRLIETLAPVLSVNVCGNKINNSFITRTDSYLFARIRNTLSKLTIKDNDIKLFSENTEYFPLLVTNENTVITNGLEICNNIIDVPRLSLTATYTLPLLNMTGNSIKSGGAIAVNYSASKGVISNNILDSTTASTIDGKTNMYVSNNYNISGALTVSNAKT